MTVELAPSDVDLYEELPQGTPFVTSLMAGALAGIAEHTITYPLDSIKTRMQVSSPHPAALQAVAATGAESASRQGRQLWRGVSSVILGAGPAHAIYFASYEWAKRAFISDPSKDAYTPIKTGMAGALATVLADAFMTPFDVIKQRMQVSYQFQSITGCIKSVYTKEGLRAFYLSYPTTLLLNVPFHVVQFPTYEFVRALIVKRKRVLAEEKGRLSGGDPAAAAQAENAYDPLSHVIAGGTAGALAAAVTCPLDVIKTTLQTRGLLTACDQIRVQGMRDSIRYIWEKGGARGFWRGVQPRILTFMPSTAICWTTYEYFKWLLRINGPVGA